MSVVLSLLVALALQAPAQGLDLQVEARSADGAGAPQLERAISRALVALGSRVVVGGRSDETCARCGLLTVVEEKPGRYRIAARHGERAAESVLEISPAASVLEQARALAIEGRLLVERDLASAPEPAPRPGLDAAVAASTGARAGRIAVPRPTPPPAPELPPPPPVVEPPPQETPAVAAAEPPAQVEVREAPAPAEPAIRKPVIPHPIPSERPPEVARGFEGWPWVSGGIGLGAGIAAGGCALVARSHYRALSDRSTPQPDALAHRDDGKRWQTASLVFSGVAVAGLAATLVLELRAPGGESLTITGAPISGGAVVGVSGSLP